MNDISVVVLVCQGSLVGGQFGQALPLLVFGVATIGAGLLCVFLPETLHKHLPETLEDAKMFGRSVSGFGQPRAQLALVKFHRGVLSPCCRRLAFVSCLAA